MSAQKRLQSRPPDVIVAVGAGDNTQEFHCYLIILELASEYLGGMVENGHIKLPDKDPLEWIDFYKFLDPSEILDLNSENAVRFAPWFHEFHMEPYLKMCDKVLSGEVRTLAAVTKTRKNVDSPSVFEHGGCHWELCMINWDKSHVWSKAPCFPDQKKRDVKNIIVLLQLACLYGLSNTKAFAEHVLEILLFQAPVDAPDAFSEDSSASGKDCGNEANIMSDNRDFFDIESIKILLGLCLPIKTSCTNRSQPNILLEGDQLEIVPCSSEKQSKLKSTLLWDIVQKYTQITEKVLDSYMVQSDYPDIHINLPGREWLLSPDTWNNNNPLLPLLIRNEIQRYAASYELVTHKKAIARNRECELFNGRVPGADLAEESNDDSFQGIELDSD